MTAKSTIVSEIAKKCSFDYKIWRIGITNDLKERKEYWTGQETTTYWSDWTADSSSDAKDVEGYFLNDKKMKGGTGGTITSLTKYIYVF
jgi:hypothetical protein